MVLLFQNGHFHKCWWKCWIVLIRVPFVPVEEGASTKILINAVCIRDFNKVNNMFLPPDAPQKYCSLKSGQKWPENNHRASFTKVKAKSLIHKVVLRKNESSRLGNFSLSGVPSSFLSWTRIRPLYSNSRLGSRVYFLFSMIGWKPELTWRQNNLQLRKST